MNTNNFIEYTNYFAECLAKQNKSKIILDKWNNMVEKDKQAIESANNVLYVDFCKKQKISKMEWEIINL